MGKGEPGTFAEAPADDVEAARALLEGDEDLQGDRYAHEVVGNGGIVTMNGTEVQVDLGNFLAARRDFLRNMRTLDPRAVEAAMVVHAGSSHNPIREKESDLTGRGSVPHKGNETIH